MPDHGRNNLAGGVPSAAELRPRERYKRPFDLAILLVAHVLLAPLWLVLWTVVPLLIWLEDRGPVFYRQERLGKGGRVFRILKFRTMVEDAERLTGTVWALANDPRVTRVGRILRATAMDELPQVINILKGEMSFVGPRAERPELHRQFAQEVPGFERRTSVHPGLTGLAQLRGDYDLSPAAKLCYDLEYIEHMSPWLDAKLLVLSVRNTLLVRWDKRSGKHPPSNNMQSQGG